MNEKIIKSRWELTRQELKQFKNWYEKQNKKTQDKIQDIINYYHISFEELNKNIKSFDKERLNRKIEEWEKLGIYKGYFKYRVEELNKYNINYRALIEILLYGAFMEENILLKNETNNLFQDVAEDCYNQGRKDLGKNEKKIPHSFFDNFSLTLVDGIIFADYLDALSLTNMQEIQRMYLSSLQQKKKLNIYENYTQKQFKKQRNRFISTTDDKYSGGLDKYITTLGNIAYLEASENKDVDVKFISDHCEHVTEMCEYMDGMIFHTKTRNVFKRPMGKTQKNLSIQDVDVMGLVLGINQPPILEHFHWCHSTLTYQINKSADELRSIIFEKEFDKIFEDEYFEEFENLDKTKEHLIYYDLKSSKRFGNIISGKAKQVEVDKKMNFKLKFASKNSLIAVHNHPSNLSFSLQDFKTFNNSKELYGIAIRTDKYIYLLSVGNGSKLKPTISNMNQMEQVFYKIQKDLKITPKNKTIENIHLRNKSFAKEMGWKYGRIKNKKND